jgi:hypothetical protein
MTTNIVTFCTFCNEKQLIISIKWVIVFGSAIIGISKVIGEESLSQTGATIATLGGGEFILDL